MQNIEKIDQFQMFFGHLKVFDLLMKNFLLRIKIAKKLFKVIACKKLQEASAFMRISVYAKIRKKSIFYGSGGTQRL